MLRAITPDTRGFTLVGCAVGLGVRLGVACAVGVLLRALGVVVGLVGVGVLGVAPGVGLLTPAGGVDWLAVQPATAATAAPADTTRKFRRELMAFDSRRAAQTGWPVRMFSTGMLCPCSPGCTVVSSDPFGLLDA
jgi:hypothetical protein